VLIEHVVAGHDIKIAVECRDYSRDQNVQWIDSLIGKFARLKVNQIVAVSSSPFSDAAKKKAFAHNIELITVNEALTTDWLNRIERWKAISHSFTLSLRPLYLNGFNLRGPPLIDARRAVRNLHFTCDQ
jgi:hypothetical protein